MTESQSQVKPKGKSIFGAETRINITGKHGKQRELITRFNVNILEAIHNASIFTKKCC
jgi:hypothetical protein